MKTMVLGGMAGLAAAMELARAGVTVEVIEKEKYGVQLRACGKHPRLRNAWLLPVETRKPGCSAPDGSADGIGLRSAEAKGRRAREHLSSASTKRIPVRRN